MGAEANLYAWVDIETTGLEPSKDAILEVALVVTDRDLIEVTAISFVVNPELTPRWKRWEERLEDAPDVKKMHTRNGLLREVPFGGISHSEVERALIQTLDRFGSPGEFTIAGSNVGAFDLAFVREQMPVLASWFSGRPYDAGVLREALRNIGRHDLIPETIIKDSRVHRAMDDIQASISEMRVYTEYLRAIPPMEDEL